MAETETVTQQPSVILDKEQIQISYTIGDLPGNKDQIDPDDMFQGGLETPPVDPRQALAMAKSSGTISSIAAVVAEGATGTGYEIVPRFHDPAGTRDKWPEGAAEQRDDVEVFLQTAFMGDRLEPLRDGIKRKEHDRILLGWGGVIVYREGDPAIPGLPPMPTGLGRFEAANARFTVQDRKPTIVPIPVALTDGRIVWVERPVYFRRILYRGKNGRATWYKQYGDWRSMDRTTGKYANGNRYTAPAEAWEPGRHTAPIVKNPALEVMAWASGFPNAGAYGISGWHSEMTTVNTTIEHAKLLYDYLKSGLFAIIIAAADRKFDDKTADEAIKKIDELGRGRTGLAALIRLSLMPETSSTGPAALTSDTSERGRIILQQMSTELPSYLVDGSFSQSTDERLLHAERLPGLLVGRSQDYNFATAAAAWSVVNRLRFAPHHAENEAFLNKILVERGITLWALRTHSPEWQEREALSSVGSTLGQLGGVSVNQAIAMLRSSLGVDVSSVEQWWGDLPFEVVRQVMTSQDPQKLVDALDIDVKLKGRASVDMVDEAAKKLKEIEAAAASKVGDETPPADDEEPPDEEASRPPAKKRT